MSIECITYPSVLFGVGASPIPFLLEDLNTIEAYFDGGLPQPRVTIQTFDGKNNLHATRSAINSAFEAAGIETLPCHTVRGNQVVHIMPNQISRMLREDFLLVKKQISPSTIITMKSGKDIEVSEPLFDVMARYNRLLSERNFG